MDKDAAAKRALRLLDLTNLNDGCREEDVAALCEKATGPAGSVAALCVWPQFVMFCRDQVIGTDVSVAAVANFPGGAPDVDRAVAETRQIVVDGADEVDVVFPYQAWLAGDREIAKTLVSSCKGVCGANAHLKVILETGSLKTPENVAEASRDAIDAGADFIKTSTGKTDVSATPVAAEVMLNVIKETGGTVGFKASGGIRTLEDARAYLAIADRIMGPEWASPKTFRFGASGLLDDLIRHISGGES